MTVPTGDKPQRTRRGLRQQPNQKEPRIKHGSHADYQQEQTEKTEPGLRQHPESKDTNNSSRKGAKMQRKQDSGELNSLRLQVSLFSAFRVEKPVRHR